MWFISARDDSANETNAFQMDKGSRPVLDFPFPLFAVFRAKHGQDLNHRLELGRKLTLTKEEYLKKLEEQIRSAKEGLAEK
jgi:hypothetical protein